MSLNSAFGKGSVLVEILLMSCAAWCGATASDSREEVIKIVEQIRRADYEGDRAALRRLHETLARFVGDPQLASRVQYWRGFALWRRAINGFNDNIQATELESDLQQALSEFEDAVAKDPKFMEARIGSLVCHGLLAFSVSRRDPAKAQELIARIRQERAELQASAGDNPRLLWVLGPMLWNTPPDRGGGQEKAIDLYKKGLEELRTQKPQSDPMEPSWGEPELLMSLAWSNLNQTKPDLPAAEQNAEAALKLVPYWHYVKHTLMTQIQEARKKAH